VRRRDVDIQRDWETILSQPNWGEESKARTVRRKRGALDNNEEVRGKTSLKTVPMRLRVRRDASNHLGQGGDLCSRCVKGTSLEGIH